MTITFEQVQFDPAAKLERLRGRLGDLVDSTGRSYASIAQETGIDHGALITMLTTTGEPISVEDMAEIVVACDTLDDEVSELSA